jgi:predicted tellurium resistance membrane protein TerC
LDGKPNRNGSPAHHTPPRRLRVVLLQIGLMDLSLSIDNVIAAVGLAPKDPAGDPVMWPIYTGVLIAILALQQIAPHAMNLLKKYPILEPTAFVLIGYVGAILIFEEAFRLTTGHPIHLPAYTKFAGILIIIMIALYYEADGAVRRLVRPIVKMSVPVMRLVTRIVSIVLWPLEQLLAMI